MKISTNLQEYPKLLTISAIWLTHFLKISLPIHSLPYPPNPPKEEIEEKL